MFSIFCNSPGWHTAWWEFTLEVHWRGGKPHSGDLRGLSLGRWPVRLRGHQQRRQVHLHRQAGRGKWVLHRMSLSPRLIVYHIPVGESLFSNGLLGVFFFGHRYHVWQRGGRVTIFRWFRQPGGRITVFKWFASGLFSPPISFVTWQPFVRVTVFKWFAWGLFVFSTDSVCHNVVGGLLFSNGLLGVFFFGHRYRVWQPGGRVTIFRWFRQPGGRGHCFQMVYLGSFFFATDVVCDNLMWGLLFSNGSLGVCFFFPSISFVTTWWEGYCLQIVCLGSFFPHQYRLWQPNVRVTVFKWFAWGWLGFFPTDIICDKVVGGLFFSNGLLGVFFSVSALCDCASSTVSPHATLRGGVARPGA